MVSVFCEPREKYSMAGKYIGNGVEGSFSGGFHYYSDRKIVGIMTDECAGVSVRKMLLGVHSPEDDSLSFVQFSDLRTLPLLWTTKRFPGKTIGRLGENYGGPWVFLSNLYVPVGLDSLIENKLPKMKDVREIPAEELKGSFFTNKLLKKVKINAMRHALCGAINLKLEK
ncbi:MAG: hypothetical protein Q8L29_00700 [archaeon]|nr:hypothetical protein [archaeon]